MAPRENKFTLVMTDEEKRWLEVLAEADDRTAAGWLRMVIKREHEALEAKHGPKDRALSKKPKR